MLSFLGPGAPRPNLSGRSDSDLGKILVVIAVVIGLWIALSWIFGRVKEYSVEVTRNAQMMVLDAHHHLHE
jgi:hypothetical protein